MTYLVKAESKRLDSEKRN